MTNKEPTDKQKKRIIDILWVSMHIVFWSMIADLIYHMWVDWPNDPKFISCCLGIPVLIVLGIIHTNYIHKYYPNRGSE